MYPYTDSYLDPKNCATKRVSRACDRCRLKKTKCDGRRCCNRCLADDAICVFSKRKRSSDRPYSSEYVQLLEDQQMKLVEGVQELYRKLRRGEGWTGPSIAEDSQGYPLVQDVLDSLAILAPSERRHPKRKVSEALTIDQDDDDAQSTQYDSSAGIESASPPGTPPDCSHLSATSSPAHNHKPRLSMASIPGQYQHLASKQTPLMPAICPSNPALQTQQLLPHDSQYWPIGSPFPDLVGNPDFSIIDPSLQTQGNCDWYPGTYMML